ncbi:transposase [candidate division KSB1 bacterium]|nr:MAG: transposase [candidate division KSB1 bacterium]
MDAAHETEIYRTRFGMRAGAAQPVPQRIHHSDQSVQYGCHAYTDLLKQHGFRISMSRKANPWDDAQAESFIATLKKEEVYLLSHRRRGAAPYPARFRPNLQS